MLCNLSHHWNFSQATLQPFVVYYRLDGELKYSNFSFNTKMLSHLKLLLPAKQKVNQFSDGAAGQYNFKNLWNLYYQKKNHGLDPEWHLFAIRNRNGPGDCI